ncbi:MAG: hypothetical protein RSB44_08770 [Carnobacterium sp.]
MSIHLSTPFCPRCLHENRRSILSGDAFDSITLEMECTNGHKLEMFLAIPKFALLFENGLSAYNDSYYFEAFTCFYSALESFREEFVAVHSYYELEKSVEESAKFAKSLFYSERIIGAFDLAYYSYFNEIVPKSGAMYLSSNDVTLRNAIFHAGKIPTPSEVFKVGERIYKFISLTYLTYVEKSKQAKFPMPRIGSFETQRQYQWAQKVTHSEEEYRSIYRLEHPKYGIYSMVTSIPLNTHWDDHVAESDIPSFIDALKQNKMHTKETFFIHKHHSDL